VKNSRLLKLAVSVIPLKPVAWPKIMELSSPGGT
jgi:hypothetical protein